MLAVGCMVATKWSYMQYIFYTYIYIYIYIYIMRKFIKSPNDISAKALYRLLRVSILKKICLESLIENRQCW